jgi:signal peptidase I
MITKEKVKKEIVSTSLIIIIVFAFRSTFFEPFRIPSGSMIPTLMIGDFILVNKFAYGFKVPFSDVALYDWINLDPVYLSESSRPARGEVIVFKYPKNPDLNYIKRVIGLPGDTIELIDDIVFVNGQPIQTLKVDRPDIKADMDDSFAQYQLEFFETKTGENNHITQFAEEQTAMSEGRWVVPAEHYFVMGDNRDFSSDSRFWGFVPFKNIRGRALFVWFSMIFPFSEFPTKFRPHRIGTPIN